MLNENIKATGQLEIVLTNRRGEIKLKTVVPNLVVTIGKNVIASRLVGGSTTPMSHMALGMDNTSPVASNTTLGGEIAASRVSLSGTVAANVVTYSATFSAGTGTGAITEAGIFNDAVAGSMLCRTTFPVVNKDASDQLTINWAVTIS